MQHLHKQELTNGGHEGILSIEEGAVGKTVSPQMVNSKRCNRLD